jgi:hypothetical protein
MAGRDRAPARRGLYLLLALSAGALAVALCMPPAGGPGRMAAVAAAVAAIVYLVLALRGA